MAITKTQNLEEIVLAFRGDVDGAYKGGQAVYFTVIRDGDQEISRQRGKVTTISELAVSGFTWPEVAAAINMGSLVQCEQQAVTIAAHVATIAERDATIQTLTAERDAALAQVAELQAQLATINGQPDENGVPLSVPMAAARIALSRAGKLAAVSAALAAIPGQPGEEAQSWWEYSSRVERNHPTVLAMTPLIGTSADVDALFIAAAAIAGSPA
jgi:hypothetical protein